MLTWSFLKQFLLKMKTQFWGFAYFLHIKNAETAYYCSPKTFYNWDCIRSRDHVQAVLKSCTHSQINIAINRLNLFCTWCFNVLYIPFLQTEHAMWMLKNSLCENFKKKSLKERKERSVIRVYAFVILK